MKNIKHIIRQSISAILISTMILTTVGCGNSTEKETETKVEVVTKPVETQPVTKPVETQPVTQPVTQSTTAATQPATVKPTEPVTQAPTTKPTQPATQPTTAATQPTTQAPTSDIHQYDPSIINTPEGQQALRNVVIKWVNIFREEEQPGCPKLTQNYDLNKVYQDRAVSVSKNYQHNKEEVIALCNKYKAGVLVPYVQGFNEKYCELYGNPYYGTHLIEAIGHVGGTLSYYGKDLEDAFDNLGKRIVTQFRNSPKHWDYVGMKVDAEISVGVYAAGAMCNQIYTAVAVGKDERPIDYNYNN